MRISKQWHKLLVVGRNTNTAHKYAFNALTSDLKKKNPHWDRKSVDDQDLTAKALFTEENTDGETLVVLF